MIKVGIVPSSSEYCNDRLFDLSSSSNRDHSLQAWADFRKNCRSLGWSVSTLDDVRDEFDVYLVHDPHPKKLELLGKDRLKRSIVQFSEPPAVAPEQYSKGNLEFISNTCSAIYCFNKQLCKEYGFIHHPWYTDLYPHRELQIMPAKERRGICMIAANKYKRSSLSKLGFRQNFVTELLRYPELTKHFELYGHNWLKAIGRIKKIIPNRIADRLTIVDKILGKCESKLPWNFGLKTIYKGVIRSKAAVLSKMKFNVVIENMYWDGYVSEKVFDALQVGCIPIYFGAPDIEDYIPPAAFINGRLFSDPIESVSYALSLSDNKVNNMIQCGQEWLQSVNFENDFGRHSYISRIQEKISNIVQGTSGMQTV